MLTICKNDKSKVKKQIQNKLLDGIVASNSNLVDDIILSMLREGVIDCINDGFEDRRRHNSFIPLNFIVTLAIAAKMKIKTSLTDIPYAIRDHRTLAELGYNAFSSDNDCGWLTEGTIRHLLGKYSALELFDGYNAIASSIMKKLGISPTIHIIDCTKIAVNFDNENYEQSSISIDRRGDKMRGYKIATLRGLFGSTGIIEEVRFGTATTNDILLSEDIIYNSPHLKEGDILIMDRGYISRKMIKHLKEVKKIEVYFPLRQHMAEYNMAVDLANIYENWRPHPNKKNQMIHHIPKVDSLWDGNVIEHVLELNTSVSWIEETQSYIVFATTDFDKSAEEIVEIYDIRTKIEEDFRQLKDFWKLEDFKSTKLHVISFHLVCVLLGYMFYQLYLNTKEGIKYVGKCLPVILKNYKTTFLNYLVLYSGEYFCIMSMREFLEFRDSCASEVRDYMLEFFE